MTAPDLSLATASMCTNQPSGLSVAFLIGILSVPGLIIPEMLLPSQFRTTTTSLPCTWLVAQVPSQEPFKGCPSWATAGVPDTRTATDNARMTINARMLFLRPWGPDSGARLVRIAATPRRLRALSRHAEARVRARNQSGQSTNGAHYR